MPKPTKPVRKARANIPASGNLTPAQLTAVVRDLQKQIDQQAEELDARYERDDEIAAAAKVLRAKNK